MCWVGPVVSKYIIFGYDLLAIFTPSEDAVVVKCVTARTGGDLLPTDKQFVTNGTLRRGHGLKVAGSE